MQKRILYTLGLACVMLAYSCGSDKKQNKPQPLDTSVLTDSIEPAKPAAKKHPGEAVYVNYCITCHQSNGTGVPGMYPPLTPNAYIENKDSLIHVVVNGMQGKIEVAGKVYNNYMAPHSHLSDQELADVISYVRSSFGNSLDPVTPAEIAAARKK